MSDDKNISEREAYTKTIATEIYLDGSFTFLKSLFERKNTRIISLYPTLNSLECEIEKGNRCFTFKTGSLLMAGVDTATSKDLVNKFNESLAIIKTAKSYHDTEPYDNPICLIRHEP